MIRPRRPVVAALLATILVVGPATEAQPEDGKGLAAAETPGMAELTAQLDDVLALAPDETCFTLSIDGVAFYRHQGDRDLIPASTQKLVTAATALNVIGPDHTYRTRVLAAEAPSNGVVQGDVVLVGSGDPLLVTDAFRVVDGMGDDEHPTRFESLAEQIVASGVTRVEGAVVGDESRYDSQRSVATWPDRYVAQGQSGPLSALSVDDGYRITPSPGDRSPTWRRSADPAADAAQLLHDHLVVRGVEITGGSTAGSVEGREVELAGVSSSPMTDVLAQLLVESDNQTGELVLKEIGVVAGDGGTTEAGAAVVEERLDEVGLSTGDATVLDGSGLDRGNRISCDDLVALLDASGGSEGELAEALPVAGSNGTLRRRFGDTPLAGRLRAKTGRLSDVTSLAGFTPMAGGEMATFAYVSNGAQVDSDLLAVQEILLKITTLHHPPCTDGGPPPMPVPVGPMGGQVALLGLAPGPVAALPMALVPLPVVADHPALAVPACGGKSVSAGFDLASAGAAGT